jgi:hypothetical protein
MGRPVYLDTGEPWICYFPTGAPPGAEKEARANYIQAKKLPPFKSVFWSGGDCYKGAFKTMAYRHKGMIHR